MGIINSSIFEFDENTSYELILKFNKNGFYVNGVKIDRTCFESVEASKKPENPKQSDVDNGEIWTYPDYFLSHFQNTINLSFGSMEGTTRTWCTYEYIKYHHELN